MVTLGSPAIWGLSGIKERDAQVRAMAVEGTRKRDLLSLQEPDGLCVRNHELMRQRRVGSQAVRDRHVGSMVRAMEWIREGLVFGDQPPTAPGTARAWRPWVLEEGSGALQMWYTASDGDTSRILGAEHLASSGWSKLGVVIDAGFAGDSDAYGVESPCVVKTPGGYLMAYGGSDGELTRLHLAASVDGRTWVAQGTFMQREAEDSGGATDPCLVVTGERWWLFFTGRDIGSKGSGTAILGAVSQDGASWDRVGVVVPPQSGEVAVSHPCVVDVSRGFQMFYAS